MPPKAKKATEQRRPAAPKKKVSVDESTLSIAERVALRNVNRQFRLESSSSSSSSSDSDAPPPQRRGTARQSTAAKRASSKGRRSPSPAPQRRPPPAAPVKSKAKSAAAVAKKAPAPPVKKNPPPPKTTQVVKGKAPPAAASKQVAKAPKVAAKATPASKAQRTKRAPASSSSSSEVEGDNPTNNGQQEDCAPLPATTQRIGGPVPTLLPAENDERSLESAAASPVRSSRAPSENALLLLTPDQDARAPLHDELFVFSPVAIGTNKEGGAETGAVVSQCASGVSQADLATITTAAPPSSGTASQPPAPVAYRGASSERSSSITTRPSAVLIARAAATKPQQSPQTMWISLSSDEEDDSDIEVSEDGLDRRHSSQSPNATVLGGNAGAGTSLPHRPTPPSSTGKAPQGSGSSSNATPLPTGVMGSPSVRRFSSSPHQSGQLPPPLNPGLLSTATQATQPLQSPLPSSVTVRDVLPPTFRTRKAHEGGRVRLPPPPGAKVIDVDDEEATSQDLTQRIDGQWLGGAGRVARPLHHSSSAAAAVPRWITPQQQPMALPARRVALKRDRQQSVGQDGESSSMPPPQPFRASTGSNDAAAGRSHADDLVAQSSPSPAAPVRPSKSLAAPTTTSPASYFTPNRYAEGRPVDVLKPLFPKTFTKEGFLDMAAKVVTPGHCLPPSEFWEAFTSVSYVGEGSFGLVWRCTTLDGDVVAVKSCPLSFHSPEAIDDGFSVLREVAVMRFLNEQHVPYVLPLHNAFFVAGTEALPPAVSEVVCLHSKVTTEVNRRRRRKPKKIPGVSAEEYALACSTNYDVVAKALLSEEELQHLTTIRRPKFLAISELDALECDATMFLVVELCDGDVEDIHRSEAVSRGVAYCVSSALVAMHKLGLVHLDLKPSNILYACERGSGGVTAMKFFLSDFGNCHIVGSGYNDEIRDAVGTYEYMDTLALEQKRCSRATDCYSLGCTMYELLMCARLYEPCTSRECGDDHSRACFIPQSRGPFLLPSTTVLHKVTELLLTTDRNRRLTAAGCLTYLVNSLGITSHHAAARTAGPSGGVPRDLFGVFTSSPSTGSTELKVSSTAKKRIEATVASTAHDEEATAGADGGHHLSPAQRALALAATPQRVRFSTPTYRSVGAHDGDNDLC